jgi:Zn-dependent M28 family amino/carboxypeptidase
LLRDPTDLPVVGPLLQRTLPVVRHFSRSNHVLFREAGIPVLQITDTANFRNPNYHRATDTWDTLDYNRLGAIVGAAAVALARIAGLVEEDR